VSNPLDWVSDIFIVKHIPDNIKRVSRSIGYAAWLDSHESWLGLPMIMRACLTTEQRAALAYSALVSLDDDTAYRTASVALFGAMNGEVV
jgi:hypothetical protein